MFNTLKENMLKIMPGPMICFLAQPYVAGYNVQAGLDKAELLLKSRLLSTIDLLGEEAQTQEQVELGMKVYKDLITLISEHKAFEDLSTRPTVSLKPSSLVTSRIVQDKLELDQDILEKNYTEILTLARERKVELTIDMEDYHWTDLTLALYKKLLKSGFSTLGTVIQTRLFRTEKDIEELPEQCRIRLCIGIYKESSRIAFTDKKEMKEKLMRYAQILLEKNVYLELATHDESYLRRFFEEILPKVPFPENRIEVQMLLGVPRSEIQQKIIDGSFTAGRAIPVRLYVPFAVNKKDSTEYSRRRLIANPDIVDYGIKNILGRLTG
ncbi:proline dehydrogenase family protein [bacterium]|nr:proline dehydrogenase family protein [bacterium]